MYVNSDTVGKSSQSSGQPNILDLKHHIKEYKQNNNDIGKISASEIKNCRNQGGLASFKFTFHS